MLQMLSPSCLVNSVTTENFQLLSVTAFGALVVGAY